MPLPTFNISRKSLFKARRARKINKASRVNSSVEHTPKKTGILKEASPYQTGFPVQTVDSFELQKKYLKTKPYGSASSSQSSFDLEEKGRKINKHVTVAGNSSEELLLAQGYTRTELEVENANFGDSSLSLTLPQQELQRSKFYGTAGKTSLGNSSLSSLSHSGLEKTNTFNKTPRSSTNGSSDSLALPRNKDRASLYNLSARRSIPYVGVSRKLNGSFGSLTSLRDRILDASPRVDSLKPVPKVTYYPRYKKPNGLGQKLQTFHKAKAEELHRVLGQTFQKNIFVDFRDIELQKPIISALQKKMGYRIPIVHLPDNYDPEISRMSLNEILQFTYEKLQRRTTSQPVIFLKGANARALKGLNQALEKNPLLKGQKVQLIVDVSKARSEATQDILYRYERPVKAPKTFKDMMIPSLQPSKWLAILPGSVETNFLQKKYRCTLAPPQLARLLRKVSQKNYNNLSKSAVLESLDSLGSLIRAKHKLTKMHPIKKVGDADLEQFFEQERLNKTSQGPIKVQDSMDMKQDFTQLVGFDGAKGVVKKIADRFKYPHLNKKFQKHSHTEGMLQTMLLNGIPGVGKTLYSETTAKELEKLMGGKPVSFISTEGRHFAKVRDHHDGGGEQAVDDFFYQVRHADNDVVVAFVDEVDAMRNLDRPDDKLNSVIDTEMKAASSAYLTAVQSLRNNPGGKQILLITATNKKQKLSDASQDRYDFRFDIKELPKIVDQKQILTNKLVENDLTFTDNDVDYIAKQFDSGGYNGRNLQSLAEQLKSEAFERMSNKSLKNQQLESGEIDDVSLKLTKPVIDSVMKQFKASRQNGEWGDEQLRLFGIG